jgi:hypothetical protein
MTNLVAMNLRNSAEYEKHLNYDAMALYEMVRKNIKGMKVILVQFKPLKRSDVERCLNDQKIVATTMYDAKNFVPQGCKIC